MGSSYLGLHTYIIMSPLVLALLIVAVVGNESVDSGDAKLQLPQGLPPFLQQLAQAGQAPAPGVPQLPPFLQALSGSSGQQQLPFVPPFLSGAGSGSTPSFLPPWLQGLAGSLPATGRADTAAVEGTEEINVAAKEEELNNAMVEYLKACYSSGYSYPSSSYTSGYTTGYPTYNTGHREAHRMDQRAAACGLRGGQMLSTS